MKTPTGKARGEGICAEATQGEKGARGQSCEATNRRMRTRMIGRVGSAPSMGALTRFVGVVGCGERT